MPRTTKPSDIKTGSGKAAPSVTDSLVLTGLTPPAPPPNIGSTGYLLPGMALAQARSGIPSPVVEGGGVIGGGIQAHIDDPTEAHMASAIGLEQPVVGLFSHNVQGAINELVAGVAAKPPMLGQSFPHMTFTGVPDWGKAKLNDSNVFSRVFGDYYPYYWTEPTPTLDWTYNGSDPRTDLIWNSNDSLLVSILGAGLGRGKAGAFTTGLVANSPINRTRGFPLETNAGTHPLPITVSGAIFPADRGVLAIVHWPADGNVAAFLAQTPLNRCVAAVKLGTGIGLSGTGNCLTKDTPPPATCDGGAGVGPSSGSIFSVGVDADGYYDPFVFPGQATGQYNLHEVATGVSDIDSTPLPTAWATVWQRVTGSITPGPGQVRWGTDATADASFDPTVTTPLGIPILGADPDAYNAVVDTVVLNDLVAHPRIGRSLVNTTNFFGYRLPYLKDYTQSTGLKYTPKGIISTDTRETQRYFQIQFPYAAVPDRMTEGNTRLAQAGNYDDFTADNWNWQLARYRHSFYDPNSTTAGVNLGSYWMVHFKAEANFEAFVRDGIMPWASAPDGYEVYGISLVDTSGGDPVESDDNLVNTESAVGPWDVGNGPAPDYGYASKSYHVLRSSMVMSNYTTQPIAVTKTFTWTIPAVKTMFVSGVAYFVPKNDAGAVAFKIADVDIDVSNAWNHFYRVDDNGLTGDFPPDAPARMSSACPAFLGLAPFAYESTPSFQVDTGVFGFLAARRHRMELKFEVLGSNGGGVFSETNGPLLADHLTLSSVGTGILFGGDESSPAFTTNASPTMFIRRPLASPPIQPSTAPDQGNGFRLTPQTTGPAKVNASVLFHSTRWNAAAPATGQYGNFPVAAGLCDANLVSSPKDVEERFLDETYRYKYALGGLPVEHAIQGPGMQGWIFGPIPTPVEIGTTVVTWTPPPGGGGAISWPLRSFFQAGKPLAVLDANELQVAGLPYRNPVFDAAKPVIVPMPSSGMLLYPQTNYSTGFVPDNTVAGGSLAAPQPDYSALTGTRNYVRAFDTAFSRGYSNGYIDTSGQPFVVFRVDGLTLADFAYTVPGPGNLTTSGIAIMVKVPGMTTWMDLGRVDGDGPSKQDPALDGAGCQVLGPNTFDSVDAATKMVYCQVRVNVGPFSNLARGEVGVAGPPVKYEVPVLVKVSMTATAKPYNLTRQYTSPGVFVAGIKPGLAPDLIRGLCGIQVVHPDVVEIAP